MKSFSAFAQLFLCRLLEEVVLTYTREMKIQVGTNDARSLSRAIVLTVIAVGSMTACVMFSIVVTNCYNVIDKVKNSSAARGMQCSREIYQTCLCDPAVNVTHDPNICLGNLQLQSARILPLVSFVLQCFSIRELFTLVAGCKHTIVRVAWAISPFILIAIRLAIYADKCYHLVTITSLFLTSGALMLFVFREIQRGDHRSVRRNANVIPVAPQTQLDDYCAGA